MNIGGFLYDGVFQDRRHELNNGSRVVAACVFDFFLRSFDLNRVGKFADVYTVLGVENVSNHRGECKNRLGFKARLKTNVIKRLYVSRISYSHHESVVSLANWDELMFLAKRARDEFAKFRIGLKGG